MRRSSILLLFLLFFIGAGCFSQSDTSRDVSDVNQNPTVSLVPSEVSGNSVNRDSIWLARSSDGDEWTLDKEVLIEHASVPNITRLSSSVGDFEEGTLMIVFVDATDMGAGQSGKERTGRYVSTDGGETWEDIGSATYVGAQGHVPVDPNLVQLPDGTLRMYYYDFVKQNSFYAADSTDGETFTVVGKVFSGSGIRITDPEVIFYNDLYYLFYGSQSGIGVATSADGLSFTQTELSGTPQGIPGVAVVDGKLRLFGCVMNEGVVSYTADESLVFSDPVAVIQLLQGPYCDPDPVVLEDGSYLLAVKKLPDVTR